jgi:hypothetical protein
MWHFASRWSRCYFCSNELPLASYGSLTSFWECLEVVVITTSQENAWRAPLPLPLPRKRLHPSSSVSTNVWHNFNGRREVLMPVYLLFRCTYVCMYRHTYASYVSVWHFGQKAESNTPRSTPYSVSLVNERRTKMHAYQKHGATERGARLRMMNGDCCYKRDDDFCFENTLRCS